MFSKVGKDRSLWTMILEKAFAKYYGNYNHIVGGDSYAALNTLSGGRGKRYESFKSRGTITSADALWDIITSHDAQGDMMTFSTAGGDPTVFSNVGI